MTNQTKYGKINISNEREENKMKKTEFLKKWRSDRNFRYDMMSKGIRVILNNVFFFNNDGTLKAVAGNWVI